VMDNKILDELRDRAKELSRQELGDGFTQTDPLAGVVEELIGIVKEINHDNK